VAENTIYLYETMKRYPEPHILEKLAAYFGVPISELTRPEVPTGELRSDLEEVKKQLTDLQKRVVESTIPREEDLKEMQRLARRAAYLESTLKEITNSFLPTKLVPILSKVPAGLPIYVGDPDVEDWQPVLKDSDVDYGLVVIGDSLTDVDIHAGDIILVHKTPTASVGDLVVFRVGDGYTVKYLAQKDGKYVLRAANPNYQDIVVDNEEFAIEGVVRNILKAVPRMPRGDSNGTNEETC
jgi:SOS-response transcriptional repressor LexA